MWNVENLNESSIQLVRTCEPEKKPLFLFWACFSSSIFSSKAPNFCRETDMNERERVLPLGKTQNLSAIVPWFCFMGCVHFTTTKVDFIWANTSCTKPQISYTPKHICFDLIVDSEALRYNNQTIGLSIPRGFTHWMNSNSSMQSRLKFEFWTPRSFPVVHPSLAPISRPHEHGSSLSIQSIPTKFEVIVQGGAIVKYVARFRWDLGSSPL